MVLRRWYYDVFSARQKEVWNEAKDFLFDVLLAYGNSDNSDDSALVTPTTESMCLFTLVSRLFEPIFKPDLSAWLLTAVQASQPKRLKSRWVGVVLLASPAARNFRQPKDCLVHSPKIGCKARRNFEKIIVAVC